MKYRVWLVEQAEADLFEIHRYAAFAESHQQADRLLDKLEATCAALANLPMRGHVPPELERACLTGYREVHCGPYRLIYEVTRRDVHVHCILDGRRDMQSLLERRLVRSP